MFKVIAFLSLLAVIVRAGNEECETNPTFRCLIAAFFKPSHSATCNIAAAKEVGQISEEFHKEINSCKNATKESEFATKFLGFSQNIQKYSLKMSKACLKNEEIKIGIFCATRMMMSYRNLAKAMKSAAKLGKETVQLKNNCFVDAVEVFYPKLPVQLQALSKCLFNSTPETTKT